jgi:hypothetical protein
MNYRALGYTQRRPREAGVYLISCDRAGNNCGLHNQQGWDVALLYFFAGSFDNAYVQNGEHAHWRVKSLRGLEYAWRAGMWIKGPLLPSGTVRPLPVTEQSQRGGV